MDDFKEHIKKSFSKCRLDIDNLYEENVFLKKEIVSLKDNNLGLKEEILSLKSELKGINLALDILKNFSNSNVNFNKGDEILENKEVKIDNLEKVKTDKSFDIKDFKKNKKQVFEDSYDALLKFKAKVNKKQMLKNKILSLINDSGILLAELKFLFVDHFKYCSKATFYNYLKEIELERFIKIERENSKNYVYLISSNKIENEI